MKDGLAGKRFGLLSVLRLYRRERKHGGTILFYECRCDCGVLKVVRSHHLRVGHTRSCGCLMRAHIARCRTHGATKTPEYKVWLGIHQRCKNPRDKNFKYYGGRGISVDPRWESFEAFLSDLGPRPSVSHSIDRIDNNSGYGPSNCRWATASEQHNNTRFNRLLTHDGTTLTLAQFAVKAGLPDPILRKRIGLGWSTARALTQPYIQRKPQR